MRTSGDEIKDGVVWNGYDYNLQVWVVDGKIQNCGHPETMNCATSCNARILHGLDIRNVKGHETRLSDPGLGVHTGGYYCHFCFGPCEDLVCDCGRNAKDCAVTDGETEHGDRD